jgi:peptidoglycan/LPS O-acetylase OafA/YrhL
MAILSYIIFFIMEGIISFKCWSSFIPLFAFFDGFGRDTVTIQYWYLSLQFIFYIYFVFSIRIQSIENLFALSFLGALIFGLFLIVVEYYGFKITSPYHSVIVRLPEFIFGILLAKNRSLESKIFMFSYSNLIVSITILIAGYLCFYGELSYAIANFIYSLGVFYLFSQISCILIKFNMVRKIVPKLSSGTFTLYCLHMSTIYYVYNYMIKITDKLEFSEISKYFFNQFLLLVLCIALLIIGGEIEKLYKSYIFKNYKSLP